MKLLYSLFLTVIVLPCIISCSNRGNKGDTSLTGKSESVFETGELVAVNSKLLMLPQYGRYWWEMRVIGLLEHGAIVNKGDSIIQLDPSDVKKYIIDRESNLETEIASLEKLVVNNENKINELESQIESETAAFNLKTIEVESSRFESERYREIKTLEYEQAQIGLNKVKKKLELNKIIIKNDEKIQHLKIQQIRNEIENGYSILPQLTIRTPISGVFQIARNYRTGSLVKIGDNIYVGSNLANVPELTWMKVNTVINETDFLKLEVGQQVRVRLDALSNIVFDGEIAYIGKLCRKKDENSKQKVFDVEVKMLKSDERLKPGMTVSCEFITN
jgi:multidrug resistance efflux pump